MTLEELLTDFFILLNNFTVKKKKGNGFSAQTSERIKTTAGAPYRLHGENKTKQQSFG